ncbi:MAG: murein biosynthesis integral membrane protein MurJ, partial [Casimicrobium sp.]
EKKVREYASLLDWGMRFALIAPLPAMAVMMLLALPMVSVLFQGGAFTARDVLQTSPAVAAYAVGVIALVWIKILAPAFYAQQDTATPVKIAIRVLIVTQLLNALFIWVLIERVFPQYLEWRHAALALSTSLGAVLNAWWLFRGLKARKLYVPQVNWSRFAWHLLFATALATACVAYARPIDAWWLNAAIISRVAMLAILFALGAAVYLATLFCFGYRARDLARAT